MTGAKWTVFILVSAIGLSARLSTAAQEPTALAADGKALMPVVTAEKASPRTRQAAKDLADYLQRITGSTFEQKFGDGATGIAVGHASDFAALPCVVQFGGQDVFSAEEYRLFSHQKGVCLIGATDIAVEHAVWDFLYRLGYRQYFPTSTWEIVPSVRDLRIAVDALERPSFQTRSFGYEWGVWDSIAATLESWNARNRAKSDFALRCGHIYQAIVATNRPVFDAHPEYLALYEGKRCGNKMCLSNPEVQKIIIEFTRQNLVKNPDADCVSMEPSDGSKWCECESCVKLGSTSDRATFIANLVAEAINLAPPPGQRKRVRYVGMLAYNFHATPPAIKVDPRVIVSVTTHQSRSKLPFDQRVEGWGRQGALTGVSEALCTYVWDWNMPACQRGSDLAYLRQQFPHFHKLGARFMCGWTNDAWGAVGFGNFLAARILWDVREAERTEEILDEFLRLCFGKARPAMEKFFRLTYRLKEGEERPLLSDDLVGRMYRLLNEGLGLADDERARARINDLILYTRYVEMYREYERGQGKERQEAYEGLMRHTYRIRKTEMVHSKAVWCYLDDFDKSLKIPEETVRVKGVEQTRPMNWWTPEDKHPWKDPAPVTEAEIKQILSAGIANNPQVDFEMKSFSENLVPATPLRLAPVKPGNADYASRSQLIYTWVEKPQEPLTFIVTGGLYRPDLYDSVKLILHSPKAVSDDALYIVTSDGSTPPDKKPHTVTLRSPYEGLHWITGADWAMVTGGDNGTACTYDSRKYTSMTRWSMYFYVPKGTKIVGGYASRPRGGVLDGAGRKVFDFKNLPGGSGYFKVTVPEGQDGKLWRFDGCAGKRILLTVPPYIAKSEKELLLPEEVVASDTPVP